MIDKANVKNIYRLSPLQGGMLFHALYDEGERPYFEQGVYRIDGRINAAAFSAAWERVVERHDALRTAFVVKGVPEPLQVVLRSRPIAPAHVDLRGRSEDDARGAVERYRIDDRKKGFDLGRDPLLRITLFSLDDLRHVMVMSFHHIVMDGWCQSILAAEFMAIYEALANDRPPMLPPAPQYREYIRWLEGQNEEEALRFWSAYLQGFERTTPFPLSKSLSKSEEVSADAAHGDDQTVVSFELTREETDGLKRVAAGAGVTLNAVVQALWGVLLGRLNGVNDALFLATVSGRPEELEGAGSIVGLFINALPVRVGFSNDMPFADLVMALQRSSAESGPHQFAPLAKIQSATQHRSALANTLLVFENFPFSADDMPSPFEIRQEDISEQTNYDVTVQVHPGKQLGFGIAFSSAVDPDVALNVEGWMRDAARVLIANDGCAVGTLCSDVVPRADAQGMKSGASEERKRIDVAVAATFTAEPVLSALSWWLEKAGYAPAIEIAPYNQVFQQLLDPTGLFGNDDGVGFLLVRFEDWARDLEDASDDERAEHIRGSFANYVAAVDGWRGSRALVHVLLPANYAALPSAVAEAIRECNENLVRDAALRSHLLLLDARDLADAYRIPQPFDDVADRAGHIPYSSELNGAIGTAIARTILSRYQQPFKVIAVDCDNTLWEGICGEDGATGVKVHGGYRRLQEFLIERYHEGFLIALCSKNNEADVWEVFEKNEEMLLRREHVVASRINWRPKSENLKSLADELNLNVNSFLFIDDSAMECAEVRENCGDALALRLPESQKAIPAFLRHLWGLDKWQVTDEDRKRSEMYAAERRRQIDQEGASSLEEFLNGLDLRIAMAPVAAHQIPRVAQLTQRTNQFNVSTIRRNEAEIAALIADDRHACWTLTVNDRFGEYGLVGLVIGRRDDDQLFIDTLLMSCRVLGRGVERCLLAGLRRYCEERDLHAVATLYVPTKKNILALGFLDEWNGERIEHDDGSVTFRRTVASLPATAPYGEFSYRSTPPAPEPENMHYGSNGVAVEADTTKRIDAQTEDGRSAARSIEASSSISSAHDAVSEGEQEDLWEIDLDATSDRPHAFYYLPLAFSTGRTLAALPTEAATHEHAIAEYVAPGTPDELAIVEIYRDLLRVDAVGLRDDFFALGGHSLTAVELLSRVYRRFETEISLRDVFESPTPGALLERIRSGEARRYSPIDPLPPAEAYPLSHAQRRLWALDDIQSEGAAYVMGGATLIEGDFDVAALEGALRGVIRRHESLRTAITVDEKGEPVQRVVDDVEFHVARFDLTHLADDPYRQKARAEHLLGEMERRRFALDRPPLLRAGVIGLDNTRRLLALYMHHVVADGWSYPILLRELVTLYRHFRSESSIDLDEVLPPLRIHYKEYAAWQSRELESERARRDAEYWRKRLTPLPPPLELPTDRRRPAEPTYEGGSVRITLDDAEAIRLRCREERATLFMFLLTAVRVLLWRYSGRRDTILGTPVAGRDHPDLADQIGFYVNTLPLRGAIEPERTFADALRRTRDEVIEDFSHRSWPFDRMVEGLEGIERDTQRAPIFDVMIALQNNEGLDVELDGLRLRPYGAEAGAGKFDLVFNFSETAGGLDCTLEYRAELFDEDGIERAGNELRRIISAVLDAPELPLLNVTVPIGRLREELHVALDAAVPEGTVIDRFRAIARKTPSAPAIVQGAGHVTYGELDERSDSVASALAERGVGRGEIVAVMLERGIDLVVAMLGIMKRGAIYLPIDPFSPEDRAREIIERSGATLLIGPRERAGSFDVGHASLDELRANAVRELPDAPSPDDGAYVIYTSGSTGTPKGVRIAHRGFLNMIDAQIAMFGVDAGSAALQFASPAFDASLSEIFMGLLAGARLVIAESDVVEDLDLFRDLLERERVTVATIPPVYLRALGSRALPSLRTLITAGEEAPVEEALHHARSGARVFNAYGPTECSVCATVHEVDPDRRYGERIPIGGPIGGIGTIVVDGSLTPVADGAAGELLLCGVGLATGYLGDDELTAERFLLHPVLGIRCYRTGDRVRRLATGELEFLGRCDDQVKIRGHRVEPEEARQAVLEIAGVRDAAVIAVSDERNVADLVGFVCGDDLDAAAVRNQLARSLPHYLVPARIVVVDALPITSNGKVDKQRLERMDRDAASDRSNGRSPGEYDEPGTEEERLVIRAFAEALKRDSVGLHEDFFDAGGDSIRAIQVRAALRRVGYDVRSRYIFEDRTPARVALRVRAIDEQRSDEREIDGPIRSTPVQEWMLERLGWEKSERFVLPLVADASEPVAADVLRNALHDVVGRHGMLRATAERIGSDLVLTVKPMSEGIGIRVIDIREVVAPEPELERTIGELTEGFRFDGATPLFSCGLVRMPERDVVVLALHHLVADAISLDVILDDLNAAYSARIAGNAPDLSTASSSFAAYAKGLDDYAASIDPRSIAEWRDVAGRARMSDESHAAEARTHESASTTIVFDDEETASIRESCGKGRVGVRDLLLIALRRAWERTAGSSELLVAVEGHGRDVDMSSGDLSLDLSRTVGWFTTVYPVVLAPASDSIEEGRSIRRRLEGLRGRDAEYGALRYRSSDATLRADLAIDPRVGFNYLGEYGTGTASGPRATFAHSVYDFAGSSDGLLDLELHLLIDEGRLKGRITSGGGFPGAFAEEFTEVYREAIRTIAGELACGREAEVRLICLPFVGGEARAFDPLFERLPDAVEGVALELPGHGARRDEKPLEDIDAMVDDVLRRIEPWIDRPYVLLGHSMGALIAYEVAARLAERGFPAPALLICSGAPSPRYFAGTTESGDRLNDEIIETYYADAGNDIRRTEGERRLAAEAARADLRAIASYTFRPSQPIDLPLLVLYGSRDEIPFDAVADWSGMTATGATFAGIAGGHDFLIVNAGDSADAIVEGIRAMSYTSAAEPAEHIRTEIDAYS